MRNSKTCVKYNDGLAGSGKTSEIIKAINQSPHEQYIIASPTISLTNETSKKIKREITTIHSEEKKKSSNIKPVANFSKALSISTHEVVLTTHATLKNALIQGVKSSGTYNLIIDECIDLYDTHYFRVTSETWCALKCYLDFTLAKEDIGEKAVYEVGIKKEKIEQVRHVLNNKEFEDLLLTTHDAEKLLSYINSTSHKTYMRGDVLRRLENIPANESAKFQALSVIRHDALEKFKSVVILSAFFEMTTTYHILKIFGFDLVNVSAKNKATEHKNRNLHIHYYMDGQYSKKVRELEHKGVSLQKLMIEDIQKRIGEKEFIYNGNKSGRENQRELFSYNNGILVNSIHGVNEYRNIYSAAWVCSMNAEPEQQNVLTSFGVPVAVINFERNQLNCYQFMARTAVREGDGELPIAIYVADAKTAGWLHEKYPDSPKPQLIENDEIGKILKFHKEKNKREKEQREASKCKLTDEDRRKRNTAKKFKSEFEKSFREGGKLHEKKVKRLKYTAVMDTYYPNSPRVI